MLGKLNQVPFQHNEPGRIKRTPSPVTTGSVGVGKQYPRTVKHSGGNGSSPHTSIPPTPSTSPSPKPIPLIVEGTKPEVKVKEHLIKEEITPTETGECQNTIVSRPSPDITPDIQLWLNTLSRSPVRKSESPPAPLSVSPVIKTIGQNSPVSYLEIRYVIISICQKTKHAYSNSFWAILHIIFMI